MPRDRHHTDNRRHGDHFNAHPEVIDYKNYKILQHYVSEKGKITAARMTNLSAKNQRKLALAIKRARFLGLMSYVSR